MFEDFFGDVGDFFGGLVDEVPWSQVVNVGSDFASSYFAGSQTPMSVPVAQRSAPAQVPAVISPRVPTQAVQRSFFNRFPNLATVIQAAKNVGVKLTANSIVGKIVTFGAPAVVSMLSAYVGSEIAANAVNEAAMRGKRHRRMNPANSKALRRAARRIKSFHRMCGTIDLLKSRGRRTSYRSRCGTCRKSPCRC